MLDGIRKKTQTISTNIDLNGRKKDNYVHLLIFVHHDRNSDIVPTLT